MSIFIGIDPGASGGIAMIRYTEARAINAKTIVSTCAEAQAWKMPDTDADIVELLDRITLGTTKGPKLYKEAKEFVLNNSMFAYLEKAHAFPGSQKITRCPRCSTVLKTRQSQGVASTFKFGTNYGTLKGILAALHIPYELVTSHVWQKALGCLTGGDKNISKAKAQTLFPDIKFTHKTADAMLIAEFCRRVRTQ